LEKNQESAYVCFRQAAKGWNRNAQYSLARATLDKLADAPSLAEALDFAARAESAGHPDAGVLLERLEALRTAAAEQSEEQGRRQL
jgi:hypothetical protein